MERWQVVTAILAGYLGLTLYIGLRGGRSSSASVQGYVAGDRDFGLLVMYFVTGATVFSAFAFLGGPGWVYSRGAAAFYILAYGVLGIAPWYWIGPRAAAVGCQPVADHSPCGFSARVIAESSQSGVVWWSRKVRTPR